MAGDQYALLLRGINVGGRSKVPMAELRGALTEAGLTGVQTYIQSGNAVGRFAGPRAELRDSVDAALAKRFDFPIPVAVRSRSEMASVVKAAPPTFGAPHGSYHCDVVFLFPGLSVDDAMSVVKLRDGVDQAWPGKGVVYFARLSAQRTKSRMSAMVNTPEYKQMTIRNWATTQRLHEMLADI